MKVKRSLMEHLDCQSCLTIEKQTKKTLPVQSKFGRSNNDDLPNSKQIYKPYPKQNTN